MPLDIGNRQESLLYSGATEWKQFRKYNWIFWFVIALITYMQDFLAHVVSGLEMSWLSSSLYIFVWLIWGVMTPFIIRLTLRYPIQKNKLAKSITVHFLIGICMAVLIELIEAALLMIVGSWLLNLASAERMMQTYLFYTFHVRILVYFLIVAVTSALDYFYKQSLSEKHRTQLKSELVSAQLKALKMQIQPHFLFNTHQAIVALILKNENKKASKMLSELSALLRLTLDISEQQLVSLKKEISTISLYLNIQQTRFSDRLQVRVDIPQELEECLVPAFIIQPLVENAIQHGFAPYGEPGKIEVSAWRDNEILTISVRDDGGGLGGNNSAGTGIGIKNILSRLSELYGENNYAFKLEKHFEKGTIATITIPYVEAEKTMEMETEIHRSNS